MSNETILSFKDSEYVVSKIISGAKEGPVIEINKIDINHSDSEKLNDENEYDYPIALKYEGKYIILCNYSKILSNANSVVRAKLITKPRFKKARKEEYIEVYAPKESYSNRRENKSFRRR